MSKGGKAQTLNTSDQETMASSGSSNSSQMDLINQIVNSTQQGTSGQVGNQTQVANQNQTGTTGLDAGSQAYVDQMRQFAQGQLGGIMGGGPLFTGALTQTPGQMAQGFMNPYQSQVIDATRGEFDHLRDGAVNATKQAATQAGAFGGSRHAIAEGARLGELDRAQASTVSGLLNSGYQNAMDRGVSLAQYNQGLTQQAMLEPMFRAQNGLQMLNLGMGPTGMVNTSTGSNAMTGSNSMNGFSNQSGLTNTTGANSSTGFNSNSVLGNVNRKGVTQQPKGGSALGGAAGGAMTGASIGSVIPGIGTGIGAAIGGGLGLLGWL